MRSTHHYCAGPDAIESSDTPRRSVSASLSRYISSRPKHIRELTEDHGNAAVLLRSTPKVTSRVDLSVNNVGTRDLPQWPDGIDPQDKQHRLSCHHQSESNVGLQLVSVYFKSVGADLQDPVASHLFPAPSPCLRSSVSTRYELH